MGWIACSSSSKPDARVEVAPDQPDPNLLSDEDITASDPSPSDREQPSCLGETHEAEQIGLDIFLMVDVSGSMGEELNAALLPRAAIQSGVRTKWDAIRQSLEAFVRSPESAGIGIGLQYFPLLNAGVPDVCEGSAACGVGGPCETARCVTGYTARDPAGPLYAFLGARDPDCRGPQCICQSDSECGANGACQDVPGICSTPGVGPLPVDVLPLCSSDADCAGIPGSVCERRSVCDNSSADDPIFCLPSLGCPAGAGQCVPIPFRCTNQTVCAPAAYAAPAIPISSDAERSDRVFASLEAVQLRGNTPTGPALAGALEQAQSWAADHPGRQVVAVLATDGLPTDCDPLDTTNLAAIVAGANSGPNPARTFVVGVFGPSQLDATGQDLLSSLAQAGGSERPFVINTNGDVTGDFLSALNEIRDTAVSCEFLLDSQAALDFDHVNLRVADPAGGSTELANVGDASACADAPGWYYTRGLDGTPVQIEVCPSTCEQLRAGGISAELEVGCATRIR